jgi:ABC-type transporter Mla subunit MlaD
MTLLQHEVDYIADRILEHVAVRLVGEIRATIRREMKLMTDQAIANLNAASDDIISELALVVSVVIQESTALAAALAASPTALDPAIQAQADKLAQASKSAREAIAAIQPIVAGATPAPAEAPASARRPRLRPRLRQTAPHRARNRIRKAERPQRSLSGAFRLMPLGSTELPCTVQSRYPICRGPPYGCCPLPALRC